MALAVLDSTSNSITVELAGAAATTAPEFGVVWYDEAQDGTRDYHSGTGVFTGSTPVTAVAAPGSAYARRVVEVVSVSNKDTASIVVTIKVAGAAKEIGKQTVTTLAGHVFGSAWSPIACLDLTTKSLVVKLQSAIATTQPAFIVNWSEGGDGHATLGTFNSTTEVAALAAPGSSYARRKANSIWIANLDTAVITAILICKDSSGTDREIGRVTLQVGTSGSFTFPPTDHGALTGLSDDDHTQYLLAAGTRALTGAWDAGSFQIRAETFQSDVATGTAPLVIASSTKVTNLNADLLDDQSGAYYLDLANATGTLTVPKGGTGVSTLTDNSLLVGAGAGAIEFVTAGAGGQILQGVNSDAPVFTATPTLGTVSSVTGQLKLANSASANLTTLQAGNAVAARTYTWPTNFGSAGTALVDAAGDGTLSWGTPASIANLTGDVTSSGLATTLSQAQIDHVCNGRLSAVTAPTITTSDTRQICVADTTSTTLYFSPYNGNRIALFDGSVWSTIEFAETTEAIPVIGADLPYDVFGYNNGGTLDLELVAWSTSTARVTALVRQDGVLCKTGALTRRYLGSIYVVAATDTIHEGPYTQHVWNYYNRVRHRMYAQPPDNSWTNSAASADYQEIAISSQVDGNSRVSMMIGVQEDSIYAFSRTGYSYRDSGAGYYGFGIAVDQGTGTPANVAVANGMYASPAVAATQIPHAAAYYAGVPAAGYTVVRMIDQQPTASRTITSAGDDGTPASLQAGMVVEFMA